MERGSTCRTVLNIIVDRCFVAAFNIIGKLLQPYITSGTIDSFCLNILITLFHTGESKVIFCALGNRQFELIPVIIGAQTSQTQTAVRVIVTTGTAGTAKEVAGTNVVVMRVLFLAIEGVIYFPIGSVLQTHLFTADISHLQSVTADIDFIHTGSVNDTLFRNAAVRIIGIVAVAVVVIGAGHIVYLFAVHDIIAIFVSFFDPVLPAGLEVNVNRLLGAGTIADNKLCCALGRMNPIHLLVILIDPCVVFIAESITREGRTFTTGKFNTISAPEIDMQIAQIIVIGNIDIVVFILDIAGRFSDNPAGQLKGLSAITVIIRYPLTFCIAIATGKRRLTVRLLLFAAMVIVEGNRYRTGRRQNTVNLVIILVSHIGDFQLVARPLLTNFLVTCIIETSITIAAPLDAVPLGIGEVNIIGCGFRLIRIRIGGGSRGRSGFFLISFFY